MTGIRWSEQSRADIDLILTYYERVDVDLAARVEQAIVEAPTVLIDHPRAGSVVSRRLRKWPVPRFPLIVLYRIVDGHVEIVRIRHMAQNWRHRR